MKAVFLDFDGVIVDSIKECYLVSKYAYFGSAINRYDEKDYRQLFYKYRGFVGPVYQYLVLHRVIERYIEKEDVDIVSDFSIMNRKVKTSEKERFEFIFFKIRDFLQKDLGKWIKLHKLTNFGRKIQNKYLRNYFVITTKDKKSVELLLSFYRIRIKNILCVEDYDKFGSKGKLITNVLDTSGYENAVFIDDSSVHLDSVRDGRIKCYFADWGYGKNSNYRIYKY